jgi:2-polyprenyl-3-methyl-5-hydroxy-6-metoxy-1,4-benzoquinol methylase
VKRLPFRLPDFTRLTWVSDEAKQVWEPRIGRIARAWRAVAWMSVAAGERACAILHLPAGEIAARVQLWGEHGLALLPLGSGDFQARSEVRVALGAPSALTRLARARTERNEDAVGRLLGYPACCRGFFEHVWVKERHTDTTWPMAINGAAEGEDRLISLKGPREANILHRWIGVRAVHHLPCRFDCGPSVRLGRRHFAFMRVNGFEDEAGWLEEILSWPVEWSALHGIAEIRSPVLKVVTQTDATAGKLTVRWLGSGWPEEGATGLRFPYQAPSRQRPEGSAPARTVPTSPPVPIKNGEPEGASWYHTDNGFSSRRAMEAAHAPIVRASESALDGAAGPVLDLGCGNGVLLRSLCRRRDRLAPHGIDRNPQAIEHARLLHPDVQDNFLCADLFEALDWLRARRWELALLMPGRLLETSPAKARKFLNVLIGSSRHVLLYVHPGHPHTVEEIARRVGLDLEPGSASIRMLKLPAH